MEKIDPDCDIELGILIHQLPNELVGKAIEVLPRGIKCTTIDETGLRVYFSSGSNCNELVRKRYIVLDGISFNIYSTVTCLTVFDICYSSFPKEVIKFRVEAKGMSVFDLYRIPNTSHCRIILDVPEVSANFQLSPISLNPGCGTIFPIAFFCRICRREGHKQYQCQQSMKKMYGTDDTGNGNGGTSSNHTRTSIQENDVKSFFSGLLNTGGGTTGTQRFGNLSARENLPAAHPSTSKMETAAEIYMGARESLRTGGNNGFRNTGGGTTGTQNFGNLSARENLPAAHSSTSKMETGAETYLRVHPNLRTGSNNGVRNTGGGTTGTQSFGNLPAREKSPAAYPSTSKKATAACQTSRKGSNNAVFGTPSKPFMRTVKLLNRVEKSSKQKYPCKEIVKFINKVTGILPPKVLREFLKKVYHKQMVFKYALEYTNDIPRLIEQIRSVISQFYQQSRGSDIAKKHIRILEGLCERLEESWRKIDY